MFCPNCGKENNEGTFCIYCGQKLPVKDADEREIEASVEIGEEQQENGIKKSSLNKGVMIAAVIGTILVAVVILAFVLSKKQTNESNEVYIAQQEIENAEESDSEAASLAAEAGADNEASILWDINGYWYCEELDLFIHIYDSSLGRDDAKNVYIYQEGAFDISELYKSEIILPERGTLNISAVYSDEIVINAIFSKETVTLWDDSGKQYDIRRLSDEEKTAYDNYMQAIRDEDAEFVEQNMLEEYGDDGGGKVTNAVGYTDEELEQLTLSYFQRTNNISDAEIGEYYVALTNYDEDGYAMIAVSCKSEDESIGSVVLNWYWINSETLQGYDIADRDVNLLE